MPSRIAASSPQVLDTFRRDLGGLWNCVGPLCRPEPDPDQLLASLHEAGSGDSAAGRLVPELEALIAGWPHYDADRRAVLSGAVAFLAEEAPPVTDVDTIVADEKVVEAAVRAVLRRG